MGYPAAYRNNTARQYDRGNRGSQGGFQNPPRPANDNRRPVPPPANDNNPQFSPGKAAAGAAARFALKRLAPKAIPYVGWALTAAELGLWFWERYHHTTNTPLAASRLRGPAPGWQLWFRCTNPVSGPPTPPLGYNHPAACPSTITVLKFGYDNAVNNKMIDFGTHWHTEIGFDKRESDATHWNFKLGEQWLYYKNGAINPQYVNGYGTIPPTVPGTTDLGSKPAVVHPPKAVPLFLPVADPMSLPVNQPVPVTRPAPARRVRPLNPWRSPVEQPQTGPQPRPRIRPGALPGPGTVTTITPGQRPRISPAPSRPQPPKPGEKEKKMKTGLPPGKVAAVINAATEGADAIDAIYGALPGKLRGSLYWSGQATTPQERALAIYNHFDEIDWEKAVGNLVANQLEDAFIGAVGRLGAKANQARSAFNAATGGGPNIGPGVGTGFF